MPLKKICVLTGCTVVVGLGWLLWQHLDGWDGVLVWLWTTQHSLHRQLADALQAVALDAAQGSNSAAIWSLLGFSLAYGVLHAAGPGHGKAVIATYLGSHTVQVRRGIVLSVLAALTQGVVAIALVAALELAGAVFGVSLRRTQAFAAQLENASFALVAVLGAVLAARSLLGLRLALRRRLRPSASLFASSTTAIGPHAMQPLCLDCGPACTHAHGPNRAQINQPLTWRTSAAVVLAIGLRPCTGAVLVLVVAYALGLRWTAVAAVLVMSLGTAVTVAVLAILAVSARQGVLRLLQRRVASGRVGMCLNLLGAAGGCLICLIGTSLLLQGLRTSVHPLF